PAAEWISRAHHLSDKCLIDDSDRRPVERVVFTEITTHQDPGSHRLEVARRYLIDVSADGLSWTYIASLGIRSCCGLVDAQRQRVRIGSGLNSGEGRHALERSPLELSSFGR